MKKKNDRLGIDRGNWPNSPKYHYFKPIKTDVVKSEAVVGEIMRTITDDSKHKVYGRPILSLKSKENAEYYRINNRKSVRFISAYLKVSQNNSTGFFSKNSAFYI